LTFGCLANLKENQLEKASKRAYFMDSNYPWKTKWWWKTWFEVHVQGIQDIQKKGHNLEWNHDPFWTSKANNK
jgi:hypothetical protein